MFDVLIIKKIEEDKERRRRESERPRLNVPSIDYLEAPPPEERDEEETERGVVIIDPDDV